MFSQNLQGSSPMWTRKPKLQILSENTGPFLLSLYTVTVSFCPISLLSSWVPGSSCPVSLGSAILHHVPPSAMDSDCELWGLTRTQKPSRNCLWHEIEEQTVVIRVSLHGRTKRSTEELIRNCPTWLLRVSLLTTSGAAATWKHFAVSMLPAMLAEAEASGAEGKGGLWSMGPCVNDNWRHTHFLSRSSLCAPVAHSCLLCSHQSCLWPKLRPFKRKRHQQGCGCLPCVWQQCDSSEFVLLEGKVPWAEKSWEGAAWGSPQAVSGHVPTGCRGGGNMEKAQKESKPPPADVGTVTNGPSLTDVYWGAVAGSDCILC